MRDRLHNYTKRTLGAGGSMNEAVSSFIFDQSMVEFDAVGVNFLAVESNRCCVLEERLNQGGGTPSAVAE